jgi:hypothetical protein
MMFIRTILLLFLILPGTVLSARGKFRPGYIITRENDTLYGLVKDRTDAPFEKIYKKVRFRCGSIFTKKYNPENISGYMAGERLYESVWIDERTDLLRTSYLSIPGKGEKRFIRVLLQDELSYYELEYLDHDSGIIDSFPLFKRMNEGHFIRVTQGLLGLRKNRLREYFDDCPKLIEKIETGELRAPLEIAAFYNQDCKNQ